MIKETTKNKIDRFRWKAQMKLKEIGHNAKELGKWALEHPVEAGTIATAGATVIGGGYRIINKVSNAHVEKARRMRYYDPSQWNWVKTSRELTGREKAEFDRRRKDGESVTSILASMRVLK